MSNEHKVVLARIVGHVQGVGFRAFVLREAERLQVSGWVRNRNNGDVEALFLGPATAVETLIAACRRGPSQAGVVNIIIQEPEPDVIAETPIRGFTLRPTI
jgi:acylphosphatase